jgi:hypothetical protein
MTSTDDYDDTPAQYLAQTAKPVFPRKICVKGLPFMWQGWNTTYYRSDEVEDGCPVYLLDDYTLYFFIRIAGCRLYRQNGIWTFNRRDGPFPNLHKYGAGPQGDPFGEWEGGMRVSLT